MISSSVSPLSLSTFTRPTPPSIFVKIKEAFSVALVALNRFTGEIVWSSKGEGEIATYNSPILVYHNNPPQLLSRVYI